MSEWLGDFHFLRPLWLLALPVAAFLLWGVWRALPNADASAWRAVCDPWLLAHLLVKRQGADRGGLLLLPALALVLAIVALAGPSWSSLQQPLHQSFVARVIVLDLSLSMNAGDYQPSRLQQAKSKVAEILQRSDRHQVGLAVFAGDAFIVTPLSYDVNTVGALLPVLDTALMPVQGSRPDRGLEQAALLLQRAGVGSGEIILLCDGFKGERAIQTAERLRDRGHFISVLAAGTREGAPIPLDDGFLLTLEGKIALPQANLEELQRLAEAGGGRFAVMQAGSDHRDLDYLLALDETAASEVAVERTADHWIDQGPWLVLLLLPVAALAFRRGWLLVMALLLTAQAPSQNAFAIDWQHFWLRADERAARELTEGRPAPLLEQSQDPAWRGSALYRRGDYRGAAAAFAELDDADAHYNRGNALAKSGRFEAAIAAYDRALQHQASHVDALYNRMLIISLLRQRQRQQQQYQDDAGESGRDRQNTPTNGNARSANPDAGQEAEQNRHAQRPQAAVDRQQPVDPRMPDSARAELDQSLQQQTLQQWLEQIPDDPGALLRRKFAHKYRNRRNREPVSASDAW